ncbi:MAG: hypothetical protein FD138_3916 [Planctomycetota bacterium]|nr:MAG: hypothetical protein FD138_3916 [Planctomycetota bacterium]
MPATDLNFVEAYRAGHAVQAHAIKFALEDAGIPVLIEGEALQDAVGDIPGGWSSTPRLMVPESQLEAAREVIRQTDKSARTGTRSSPRDTVAAAVLGIVGIDPYAESELQPDDAETTHCLACDAIMSESEETCPKCGWSYSQTDGLEPYDEESDA